MKHLSSRPQTMRLYLVFLLTFWLLVIPSHELSAQTTTSGGLTGVVTDPRDAVVPDADVELKDNAKGTTLKAKTNAEGVYQFSFLLPSKYTLTVVHPGFQTTKHVLDVFLGTPATLNIRLGIASASTTVYVTEEGPLIQAENGDASTTINRLQVSQVPNPGNDLTYIAQTSPGAIMNTDGGVGNFSILGIPGTSNHFSLNGMDDTGNAANVNLSGALNLLLGQNQIQEATVVSNGYSGYFGGNAGADVSYVTKSGGNEFHGNAVYFWNGRVFNANDWFNNANSTPRPFSIANQWAGSLGGPIKKDKLFFFFNTEGLRVFLPSPIQVVLPSPQFEAATIANIDGQFGSNSASDAFYKQMFNLYNGTPGARAAKSGSFSVADPLGCQGFVGPNGLGTSVPCAIHFQKTIGRPTDESIVSGRVDWNIRPSDRAFFLLQYDHGDQVIYTDPVSPVFNVDSEQPWWQSQFNETHTFGPSAVNQFLLAGMWFGALAKLQNQALSTFPTVLMGAGPFSSLGGEDNYLPAGRNLTRYQITDDLVKIRGDHKLCAGVNFTRNYWSDFDFSTDKIGTLDPLTEDAFYQGGVDPAVLNGTDSIDQTYLYQSFPYATEERINFYNLGLYAQDEWHAQSNLTLTVAFRSEHQANPTCARGCFAKLVGPFESISHDPDQPYNKVILSNQKRAFNRTDNILWAPRFSFAWQPFGVSHNLVLRGGIGIFYDPLAGFAAEAFATNNPPLVNSFATHGYNLTPNENNSLFKVATRANATFVDGFNSGENVAQIGSDDPFFVPPSMTVQDEKIHSPQYQKWSLQAQGTFGVATSLTIGYFGNHGIHELVQNPSANAFGFGSLPAGQCTSPPVPPCADPRFGQVTEYTTPGVSNYNGMVASFQHRLTRWSQGLFQANYTYGHAFDEASNGGVFSFTRGSALSAQDPNNLRGSYGPADYDVRHSFNASYVWELPLKAALGGHGSDYLVKGWQVSGTIFARTGLPYTVFDGIESSNLNQSNFFGPIYAVPVRPLSSGTSCGEGAAIALAPHPCQPPQVLVNGSPSPNALFVQTGCETGFNTGTLPGPSGPCSGAAVSFAQGRNRFRSPAYFNTDFTILKNTRIRGWENAVLGIGFQFFNFFNHPNFGLPDNLSSDGTFGQILYLEEPPTSILGAGIAPSGDVSPRMIQLKAQLQF